MRDLESPQKWILLLLFFAALLVSGCNAGTDHSEKDAAAAEVVQPAVAEKQTFGEADLQGTWKVIEATSNGKPNENAIGVEYTFAGGILLIRRPGREAPEKHAYEIDLSQRPPYLDSIVNVLGSERRLPGIFEIRDGDVAWYTAYSAYPRPTEFTADEKGYSYHLLRLEKRAIGDRVIED